MKLSKIIYLEEKTPNENERVLILHKNQPLVVLYLKGEFHCVCCNLPKEEQPKTWMRLTL